MTYAKRLLISKLMISLAALLVVVPLGAGIGFDQIQLFWLMSLPVFFYQLWGKLHGTGRSVRTVGFLGLAYCASYFATSVIEPFSFIVGLSILFAIGTLTSIKRAGLAKENSEIS